MKYSQTIDGGTRGVIVGNKKESKSSTVVAERSTSLVRSALTV